MKLDFLTPVYAHAGPVASVYLDTSRDIEDPDRALQLRWRHLRDSLLAHDADEATVGAVEEAIGADRQIAGPHGQAVFAARGRLALAECLPEPPGQDGARFGSVPDVLPLALRRSPDTAYAAVALHRVHRAEGSGTGEELEVAFDTGRWPMGRVAADHRPDRRVPVDDWPGRAEELVDELTRADEASTLEVIVLAGDPWAANTVTRLAPKRLRDRLVKIKSDGPRRRESGRALLEEELAELFAGLRPHAERQQLDAFHAQRARAPHEVEGVTAAVAALQQGRAQALVLSRPLPSAPNLWVGTEPTHLALSGKELKSFGVDYYWEEEAGNALIRAAAATQAELIVVHREELPLDDGVGVLLRYTGT
ncbi:baeRF2 domain-containing protein [Streptomyces sp. NPDC002990]